MKNIINELKKLCSELISTCGHSQNKLSEQLSIITNDLELDKIIHID